MSIVNELTAMRQNVFTPNRIPGWDNMTAAERDDARQLAVKTFNARIEELARDVIGIYHEAGLPRSRNSMLWNLCSGSWRNLNDLESRLHEAEAKLREIETTCDSRVANGQPIESSLKAQWAKADDDKAKYEEWYSAAATAYAQAKALYAGAVGKEYTPPAKSVEPVPQATPEVEDRFAERFGGSKAETESK